MKHPKVKRVSRAVIIPPEGGWKPHTYYHVEVSWNASNPIYGAIFFSGFLDSKGNPAGYNEVGFQGETLFNSIGHVHYLRAIKELITERQLETVPNKWKLAHEINQQTSL